ncbi:hypothetical protein D3C87_1311270 [compost metagenome]
MAVILSPFLSPATYAGLPVLTLSTVADNKGMRLMNASTPKSETLFKILSGTLTSMVLSPRITVRLVLPSNTLELVSSSKRITLLPFTAITLSPFCNPISFPMLPGLIPLKTELLAI